MKNTITFFLAMLCLLHSATSQVVENEQYPISMLTVTGSTPADPAAYVFEEVENGIQGVNIHLPPTELTTLFMQSGNVKLAFNLFTTGLFFTNLEINYDNTGWTSLYSGSSQQSHGWVDPPASFQTLGSHNLKVRYLNASAGTWKLREYNVVMVPAADEFHRDGLRSVSQNGYQITTGNQLYLYDHPACPDAEPVLVVEGFDPVNTTYPEFYVFRGAYLSERLFELGYKVYILNFNMNSQSMAINADVVTSAIEYVSSINDDKNVLLVGASMGGIISRYATARAESMESPLPVSGLVTMDAPHQGAYIDPDLQDYLKDESESLAEGIIGSPAAKQLLTTNVFDSGGGFRTTFMGTLLGFNSGAGYPILIPTIGIAHSNSMPNQSTLGSTWLSIGSNNFVNDATSLAAGSYLSQGFTNIDPLSLLSWFPLLGSVSINRTENHPTFVSHTSALDLDGTGSSAMLFDVPSLSASDFHDIIPDDVVNSLYDRFLNLTPETILANKTYNYSSIIGEHIRRDMEVYGTLKVNEDGYTGFQDAPLPGSTLADYTLVTNRCDPVVVDVKSGGLFDVGMASDRRSTTIIGTGSTLIIRAGGILRVNGNSSLVIEKNANLIIEDGAIVQLWDGASPSGEARIVLNGTLTVGESFDFSGNGYFDLYSTHTIDYTSNKFVLKGEGMNYRLFRLNDGTDFNISNITFILDNGLVEFMDWSTINIDNFAKGFFTNVTFETQAQSVSAINGYGYQAFESKNCVFANFDQGIFLEAPNPTHYTHTRITNCDFKSNKSSIFLLEMDQAYVTNTHIDGYNIGQSNGIEFHNIDQLSITTSTITRTEFGIRAYPGNEITRVVIHNSTLNANEYGVYNDDVQSKVNIVAQDRTVFEDNTTAIYIAQGGLDNNGLDYGLVKLDCISLINNDVGVEGKDLLLMIDAYNNSKQMGPGYALRSNTFRCGTGQVIFDLCYEYRLVNSTNKILARGNFWDHIPTTPYIIRSTGYPCSSSNAIQSEGNINRTLAVTSEPETCGALVSDPDFEEHIDTKCKIYDENQTMILDLRALYKDFESDWRSETSNEKYDLNDDWYNMATTIAQYDPFDTTLSHVCHLYIQEVRTFSHASTSSYGLPDDYVQQPTLNSFKDDLDIFPLPFDTELYVRLQEDANSEITVLDMLGKIVHTSSSTGLSIIDTHSWRPGIYILRITDGKGQLNSSPIIKQGN